MSALLKMSGIFYSRIDDVSALQKEFLQLCERVCEGISAMPDEPSAQSEMKPSEGTSTSHNKLSRNQV